ncbi:GntR family transcriptional regulator [Consotaella salsifontis]|uniref:DNA-binding transcriptional regulator, GntR family n=1 Tax=Consotaella salsifontis TaxID=1365950 RepID=A0A1T4RKK6_9HYPH|nr:GntR family transcriptional regulator [Consotaella salsifontis]SKA16524.1 DNA-binding transcriptional regulator, GntR family [Consotaella salsifontis]
MIATITHSGTSPSAHTLTAAQLVHQRLREEIVSLRRRPGDPINEKEIAAESGVSRTPVREALLRLAEEKLIEIVPKSGTIVAKIPVDVLPEAIVARTALEQVTVRAAAERARGSDIASLRAILELQRESQESEDYRAFHAADEALHRAIAQAAGYPGIWTIIEQLKIQLDRYRRLTLPQPNRMERACSEHTAIVEAVAAHDTEAAVQAMDRHMDGLGSSLGAIRDLSPEYFTGDVEAAYIKWGRGVARRS